MSTPLPIVYFSSSNNTKYIGEIIAKGLEASGHEAILIPVEKANNHAGLLENSPAIGIGSPVYGGLSEPMADWASGFNFTGKKVFVFLTAAATFLDAEGEAARLIERSGGMFIGAFGLRFTAAGDGIYLVRRMAERFPLKREDLRTAYAFGRRLGLAIDTDMPGISIRSGIRQRASQSVIKFIKPPVLFLIKKFVFSFSPVSCISCKKCEKCCPMGAISITDGPDKRTWDRKRCVCCLRCLKSCPTGALCLKVGRGMEYYRGPWQLEGYVKPEDLVPDTQIK